MVARSENSVQVGDRQLLMRVLAQGWRYRWMIILSLIGSVGSGALMAYLLTQLQPLFFFMGQASQASTELGTADITQVTNATGNLTDLGLNKFSQSHHFLQEPCCHFYHKVCLQ